MPVAPARRRSPHHEAVTPEWMRSSSRSASSGTGSSRTRSSSAAVQLSIIYVVLLWLGTATGRSATCRRTENPILPYFAAALIIFFTPLLFVFAVVLYLIVRPRETLAEVYERSLAEESLLAEVEKNELCPVCRDRVDSDWLVCPNCRTRLHRVCPSCNRLADPTWPLCAYCGASSSARPRRSRARRRPPVEEPVRRRGPRSTGPPSARGCAR